MQEKTTLEINISTKRSTLEYQDFVLFNKLVIKIYREMIEKTEDVITLKPS